MSRQVLSFGLMAPLTKPIGNHSTSEWQELSDRLHETSSIRVNYEGTLVFSDNSRDHADDVAGLVLASSDLTSTFFKDLGLAKLEATHETQFYACWWYNGSDSDMMELTLAEFLKRTGQSDVS